METIVAVVLKYRKEHPNTNHFEYTGEQSEKEKKKNGNVRLALYSRYIKRVFNNDWVVKTIKNKVIIEKQRK